MAAFVPYILSIFSNPPQGEADHLSYIADEMKALQELVDDAKAADDVNIDYRPMEDNLSNDLDLQALSAIIYKYRKKYTLIHYSGHADRSTLSLQKANLRAENFIRFIGQCEGLKIVVLNACSTEGFVKKLLETTSVRAVIATNNPVKDKTAKIFSEEFYRRLVKNDPLTDAFITALSVALPEDFDEDRFVFKAEFKENMISGGNVLKSKAIGGNTRGVKKKLEKLLDKDDEEAKWGLYTKKEDILDWKLFENVETSEAIAGILDSVIKKLNLDIIKKETEIDEKRSKIDGFTQLGAAALATDFVKNEIATLETAITQLEDELNQLKQQLKLKENDKLLSSLESSDDLVISRYKENLVRLNYEEQLKNIKKLMAADNAGVFQGFIIHGTVYCCLDHLARNIVKWLGINNDVEKIFYDFTAGSIGDFWQVLKNERMPYLVDVKPESIVAELYKQFVDTNNESQKNFIFIFRNVAGKSGTDNNTERILEFWKKLVVLWQAMPEIKKLEHNIYSFIIDNSCTLVTEPELKSSKEDDYKKMITAENVFKETISLMPVVAPIKADQVSDWEIACEMPKTLRYNEQQLKAIIQKTNGLFLPTVKEISINKIKIEGKKPVLLSYIKELIETP